MKITDEQLSAWTNPAFGTEEQKAEETRRIIREAVKAHPLLKDVPLAVFAKGSYKNNTNVRRESDIDIAVEYRGMIRLEYAPGLGFQHTGLIPYSGTFRDSGVHAYKAAVGEALRTAFGSAVVDGSGNRVFKVREGSKSLQADVIPCTTYRFYTPDGYYEGIELILNRPDGLRHFNYPEYHYNQGVAKNEAASRRYKSAVRILKNMQGFLESKNEIKPLPSYLIECLAFNIHNTTYLNMTTWRELIKSICALIYVYAATPEPLAVGDRWMEVNNQKYLFAPQQTWQRPVVSVWGLKMFGALQS